MFLCRVLAGDGTKFIRATQAVGSAAGVELFHANDKKIETLSTGATVYGTLQAGIMTAQWVSGNLQGVLYNSTGNPVLDPDGPGFGGTVFGNVVSNVNTGFSTFNNIMVSGMHTAGIITCQYIFGGFSGKIYNNQGNPIFNSEDASFGGTLYGDVVAGSSGISTFKDVNVTGVATIANIAMASTQSSITLPDSAEIVLGDSADFSMHHDGDHTYLDEAGQGNLKIRTNNFRVTNVAETKPSITAQVTQGVELHYDGNKKLETTNTGVVVTGVITATDANFRNIKTSGITTIQDHLEVNDSTGSGTEYNLNVKTSGSSTFGVLGNGAILLGNNSSAPFMATNDHHATSKKYVDDAIGVSTVGLASTGYVNQAVASAGGEWTLTGTNLAPNSSSTNVVVDSSIGIGTTVTSGARVTVINEMFENFSDLPVVSVHQKEFGEEINIQEWRFDSDHPLRIYTESNDDYNLGLVQFAGDSNVAKSYMKFHGDGSSGITFHTGTTSGNPSQVFSMNASGLVRDKIGPIRGFGSPITKNGDYTPDSGDEGYLIEFTSGNATVSYDGGFNEGCGFHIVNNSSSSMSIIQGAGNTMYFTEDGTTGNRTLGARGLARVFYMDSSWWIDGSGLS